ncbi:MAG TPA: GAF domain-containing protein, partial [Anaerolineae bacterium]|nr:GAF domain-containing protein [Anaerolineae bacterium]
LYDRAAPWSYTYPVGWLFILIGVSAGLFLFGLIYRRLRSDSPVVRQQSRIILWGSLLAFLPFMLWVVQALANPEAPFNPLLYLPTFVLFPLAIGVAMQRYHLLNIDRLITGGITYAIMGGLVALVYLGILTSLTVLLRAQESLVNNPAILVILVLLVAIAFDVLRQRLNRTIDRVLFRGRLDTQTVLQNYSRNLTEVADLPRIIDMFRLQITEMYRPERLYVYLLDNQTNLFCVQPDPAMPRLPLSAAQCVVDSPLARWIRSEPGPKYLPAHRALPEVLEADRARLETIGATLYVPLVGRDRTNGWLALGHKHTGQPYSTDDLNLLSALANQSALALERASVFDDLQRRNRELDALSRISQAVNFTLDVDDILELIYTQTSKVLDTRNFYIAMIDEKRGTMRFAFYIEGAERLYPDDEWPAETGLIGEIMRRGQPIVTDDYVAECERRGLKPGGRPGKAWMGVPLSGGDRPMGLMAVSDFRPEVTYTQEQLQVFAAIADQAASVLYKTRLYRQTEERA